MHVDKVKSDKKRFWDRVLMLALGVGAFLLYVVTVSHGVFPGESSALMVTYSGIQAPLVPAHPIWGRLVGWLAAVDVLTLPLRLNLLSVACGALCVGLFYRIVSEFVFETITEEYSVDFAERASTLAGVVGAVALISNVPFWSASTHLQYQTFDVLLLLVAIALVQLFYKRQKLVFLYVAALLYGVGCVESTMFLMLLPCAVALGVIVLWRSGVFTVGRFFGFALCFVLGLGVYFLEARAFLNSAQLHLVEYEGTFRVLVAMLKAQKQAIQSVVPRVGWILLLLSAVLPWIVAVLLAPRALNNERTWSQYILNLALTVLCVICLVNAPAISPWGMFRATGELPVALYAMVAFSVAYLTAFWYLLLKVRRPPKGMTLTQATATTGEWLSIFIFWPFVVLVCVTALINYKEARGSRGEFADRFAQEVLERMDGRSWFIGDGLLDNHLLVWARERKQDFTLIGLEHDMNPLYQEHIRRIAEKKSFVADKPTQDRLFTTLKLGVLPFVQDWMSADKEIASKLAIYSIPDFWYNAGLMPVPNYLFFVGLPELSDVKEPEKLLPAYKAFWTEMQAVLDRHMLKSAEDPVEKLRKELRRQLGFIGNNLGVMFEDLKLDNDAEQTYAAVRKMDPENISALFNQFEMVRRGLFAQNKDKVEKELKDFLAALKRRYPLWSLSRYYGYVRSPELFAKMGWGWAVSGQAGAAFAGVNRAIELLPEGQKTFALQTMAAIYSMTDNRAKSAAVYKDMLRIDSKDRVALVELTRLALLDGNLSEAKGWLDQAQSAFSGNQTALGVEWAMYHLAAGDMDQARLVLHRTTDLQPKNLQAWSMLCILQLQQGELQDVEKITIPKMEAIVGANDNYFIQVTKGQLSLAKFEAFRKTPEAGKLTPAAMQTASLKFLRPAREAFLRASILSPQVHGVKDMVLQLDIAMNDEEHALLHARQVLRTDRKNPLANYVMGSLRLKEGAYGDAEDFLRRSVEDPEKASSAALNDLAETLRRIKKMDEAEKFARQAVKKDPSLYIAWETLASILLSKGSLEEAESAIKQAQKLDSTDKRCLITLAKIYLRKGDMDRARMTVNSLKDAMSEFSPYDREELLQLQKEIK